jgi:integrase
MSDRVCSCGNSTCYVALYYAGKDWKYRRDKQGDVLTFGKATKLLNAIRGEIDAHSFDPLSRTDSRVNERRFANKWEVYIEEKDDKVQRGELSPSYVRVLKVYRRKYYTGLDNFDVRDIGLENIAAVRRMVKGKLKSARNVLNALSAFFHWCLDNDGSVKTMPKFPVVSGDDSTPQGAIGLTEQRHALARIPAEYSDPIEFGMETGCRPGEIAALKVKDIQGEKALICRTYSDYTLRETTKQKRKEYIPLSDRALQIAQENSAGKHPETFLFINPNSGDGYRPKRLSEIWNEYSETGVKLYEATRHSFCTQLVEDGVDLITVSKLARHSDIRTTKKYVHPTDETARSAVNKRGMGKVVLLKSGRIAEGHPKGEK